MKLPLSKKKRYDQPYLYSFTSQLYSLLRNNENIIVLKKLKNICGSCDWEEIDLDYRKELIPTLIHEVLHYLHEDWSETKVLKVEKHIVNSLSVKQIKTIIKRFAAVI